MEKTLTPKRPLIIAHRGASSVAPENTLAAFEMALELGADGIELDVMLSADGKLAVIHDFSVDRTTNGTGKVPQLSLAKLKTLDAGFKKAAAYQGERIPTLEEVFSAVGGKLLINVELKNYHAPFDRLTEAVVACVQEFGLLESVLLSSFNPFNLLKAQRLEPALKRGLLTVPGKKGRIMRGWPGRFFLYDALHPYFCDVDAEMVQGQHSYGRQVNVWTVNSPEEMQRLADLEVDMLITDDPALAREVLEG